MESLAEAEAYGPCARPGRRTPTAIVAVAGAACTVQANRALDSYGSRLTIRSRAAVSLPVSPALRRGWPGAVWWCGNRLVGVGRWLQDGRRAGQVEHPLDQRVGRVHDVHPRAVGGGQPLAT